MTLREDATSDAVILAQLEAAGWRLWIIARRDDRTVAGPSIRDVARRAFPREKKAA